MKVLIVFNHPAPYKVLIFNELAKHVDLTVIFERNKAKNRPDKFYSLNKYGFKAITLTDCYFGNEGTYSNNVKKFIKQHHSEFDLIVMNGYSHLAEMKAIDYMKRNKIPFTLMINGGVIHSKELKIKKWYKKKYVSSASYFISPSLASDDYLVYYGADKEKIFRYPYSNISFKDIIDSEVDKTTIRNRFNLPLNRQIFVNASQFIDRKNNMHLIELFKDREEHLLLVGDGPELEKYQSYIKENKMHNVTIVPFQERKQLFEILKGCDAFITLAKEDIFGHTIIEALANGLPVISSNKVNSALEVLNGKNGFVVDINNDEEIIDRINKVRNLDIKDIIETAKEYTVEKCGQRLADIFGAINE